MSLPTRRSITPGSSILRTAICTLLCLSLQLFANNKAPLAVPTSAPHGPFRVVGNQLLDSSGAPFLIRGTQTTPFQLHSAAYDARSTDDFGPHSATSLSAIRLRMNMNAVRIPVDITESDNSRFFPELAKFVHLANQSDLLVVLAASEPGAGLPSSRLLAFWAHCAAVFKDNPNLLFDAFDNPAPASLPAGIHDPHSKTGWDVWRHGMQDVVETIRSTGARQPVVLMAWHDGTLFQGFDPVTLSALPDVLYEVAPGYDVPRTDADRDAQFGFLTHRAPLIANDWDLHLDDPKACASIPSDTDTVSRMVLDNVAYFDTHNISWTVSTYQLGRLLEDTVNLLNTKLEAGVTCGNAHVSLPGMGRLILSRMFGTEEGKLIAVNVSGGISLARGGFGIAYGRIMAAHDSHDGRPQPAYRLGDLSVKITDSRQITRPARISWASAGWGQLDFIVPEQSAAGPGQITIERANGSRESAAVLIADTAPGLFTSMNCQGPAIGYFTLAGPVGQSTPSTPISQCKSGNCSTVSIPVTSAATTKVRLIGNGFRYAKSPSDIEVTIAGLRVPVLSYRAAREAGVDEVTVSIPLSLAGTGETDLICHVNGRLANVVRISIGPEQTRSDPARSDPARSDPTRSDPTRSHQRTS